MYRLKRTPDLLAALHDHARRARGWRLAYFLQLFTSLLLVVLLLASAARRDGAAGAGRVPLGDARPVRAVHDPDTGWRFADEPEPPVIPLPEPVAAPLPELEVRTMKVTAYCPCAKCCGEWADGVTASGKRCASLGRFVAAPKDIPFGTMLVVPGYGTVPVEDRGGAIKGNRLDVYCDTHSAALRWGVRDLAVTILREGQR